MQFVVNAIGQLREAASWVASYTLVFVAAVATLAAFAPKMVSGFEVWMERRPWRRRSVQAGAVVFLLLSFWGAREQRKGDDELRSQNRQMAAALQVQATTNDIQGVRQELRDGFRRLESAVYALSQQSSTTTTPTSSTSTSTTVPGAVFRHLRFTERRVPSDDSALPYGLQVVVQTDVATQPTALTLRFDGPIGHGDFFVTGQPVRMNVETGIGPDGKSFGLSFGFPAWTPETPVVVTVRSKEPVRVTALAGSP